MYDFYFGSQKDINNDEEKYLLSIKRMMPKWMNSIPDTEFIAINEVSKKVEKENPVFVETGLGASSIVLLYNAIKNNGVLYSWDTNAEKASQIRTVCTETICKHLECDINKHWKVINYLSTSDYAGLSILNELKLKVDLFFHDSEHVLDVILEELNIVSKFMSSKAIICMDDANYNFKHTNSGYINVVRKKIGLPPIPDLENNKSRSFYIEVEEFLNTKFKLVQKIDDSYKYNFDKDIFFSYFNNELKIKAELKMENLEDLKHRFDAWIVS